VCFFREITEIAQCGAPWQWQIHWGGAMGAIAPSPTHNRARKIFLNMSENKCSDRKLPLSFVSSTYYVE